MDSEHELIWSAEDLGALCHHEDPTVREWAFHQVVCVHPTPDEALWRHALLDDDAKGNAEDLLEEACETHRVGPWGVLLDVVRADEMRQRVRPEAAALLGRAAPIDRLTEMADVCFAVGAETFLRFCHEWRHRDPSGCRQHAWDRLIEIELEPDDTYCVELLIAIARMDDVPFVVDRALELDDENGNTDEVMLERAASDDIVLETGAPDWQRAVDAIDKRLASPGLSMCSDWQSGQLSPLRALTDSNEPDKVLAWIRAWFGEQPLRDEMDAWCAALVAAVAEGEAKLDRRVAIAGAVVLGRVRHDRLRDALRSREGKALARAWSAGATLHREQAARELRAVWSTIGDSERLEVLEVLAGLKPDGISEHLALLHSLGGDAWWLEPVLADVEILRWHDLPELSQAACDKLMNQMIACGNAYPASDLLKAVSAVPHRWASDLLVRHADELLAMGLGDSYWDAVRALADPRTLSLAIREWKPGETHVASCADLIARLSDRVDELPPELIRELDERDDLTESLAPLVLRCKRCGRCHRYRVARVLVDADAESENWDGVVPLQIIPCKHCGAVDEYELDATTATSLTLRALASDGTEDAPVVLGTAELWDGTIMRRPSQAIAYLKGQADASPTNGAAWRRLGNIQERLGLDQDAILSWRKAIEVDDKECEAASSLAFALWQQADVRGALDALAVVVERFDRTSSDVKESVAVGIANLLPRVASFVDGPLALDVYWAEKATRGEVAVTTSRIEVRRFDMWKEFAAFLGGEAVVRMRLTNQLPTEEPRALLARLGRRSPTRANVKQAKPNEKCPCGSGRKYKKCCGRAW
jgi:hypothetical protein